MDIQLHLFLIMVLYTAGDTKMASNYRKWQRLKMAKHKHKRLLKKLKWQKRHP